MLGFSPEDNGGQECSEQGKEGTLAAPGRKDGLQGQRRELGDPEEAGTTSSFSACPLVVRLCRVCHLSLYSVRVTKVFCCYGLKAAHGTKKRVEVLTPRTLERALIWK